MRFCQFFLWRVLTSFLAVKAEVEEERVYSWSSATHWPLVTLVVITGANEKQKRGVEVLACPPSPPWPPEMNQVSQLKVSMTAELLLTLGSEMVSVSKVLALPCFSAWWLACGFGEWQNIKPAIVIIYQKALLCWDERCNALIWCDLASIRHRVLGVIRSDFVNTGV